jgi:site-specific recombinase XerD
MAIDLVPLNEDLDRSPATEPLFTLRDATPFVEKSLSEATRRVYRAAIVEFFHFVGRRHPGQIVPDDVRTWRDDLIRRKRKPATIALKLSVLRSFFDYLLAAGEITRNPASSRLVPSPALPEHQVGRALSPREARILLAGPDRSQIDGARDYALMLVMLRLSLRVSEACSLRASSVSWSHGRWTLRVKVKGGRERTLPLPHAVKRGIDDYLRLDATRRRNLRSDGHQAYLFQPLVNYRTLEFDKPLSTRMARNIVAKWGDYCGLGKLSPHDLRRTAITRALDQGLTHRQVQMMSGHRDPKTVMRYDHGRDNLELNAINFLDYETPDK